jgi:hypothetical protein
VLKAHDWTPRPLSLPLQRPGVPVDQELEGEREIRKVWVLEELEGWNLKPTSDPKDHPLTLEEREELAENLVNVELELERPRGKVPWYIRKLKKDYFPSPHGGRGSRRIEHFIDTIAVGEDILENDPHVQALKNKIIEDYTGSVFRDEVWTDPPIRNPHGEAKIDLKPGVVPTKQRPFVLIGERREALKKIVEKFEGQGLLEETVSPWLSPAFPVPKKEPGTWRLVIDYRVVNEATITDAYPTPLIEEILIRQGQFKIWSVLDMKNGFHQIPLSPDSRPITAMSTPIGPRQWKVLPMGVTNGVAIFQRLMESELQDFEFADPYVDDTIIGSTGATMEEAIKNHDLDIRRVMDRFKKDKLVVDINKTHLFTTKVEFCGHVLTQGTRSPAPKKLLSIQKWELPITVTALRAFLGLTNYYSSYVPNYASLAAPLTSKLQLNREDGKKGSKKVVLWLEDEVRAFEAMKEALAKSLALFHLKPDTPFILETDASKYAIGAVLKQEQNGELVPVAFFSRKLSKTQRNWTPREQETYAIVMALRKWSGWIGYQPVVVKTDHKSLENWTTEHVDTPSGPAGRRARWHETLSKFDIKVVYTPGKDHLVADALSRWAYPASKALADISKHGNRESTEEVGEIIKEEVQEEEEKARSTFVVGNGTLDRIKVDRTGLGRTSVVWAKSKPICCCGVGVRKKSEGSTSLDRAKSFLLARASNPHPLVRIGRASGPKDLRVGNVLLSNINRPPGPDTDPLPLGVSPGMVSMEYPWSKRGFCVGHP